MKIKIINSGHRRFRYKKYDDDINDGITLDFSSFAYPGYERIGMNESVVLHIENKITEEDIIKYFKNMFWQDQEELLRRLNKYRAAPLNIQRNNNSVNE